MSHSPIFDQLYTEFLEAHRVVPVRATMFFDADKAEPVFDIPELEATQEIPVIVEPAPSVAVIEETDEEWDKSQREDNATWLERIQRDLAALPKQEPAELDIPAWMTDETSLYAPIQIKANDAMEEMASNSGFVDLLAEHQHNILYPVKLPTREALALTSQEDEPVETPAEEPQHVFPLTRDEEGRRKFVKSPTVRRIREIIDQVVYEAVA